MNDYDQVPYHSHPYRLSHPDHLAAVAALHGLDPVPVDGARVLEVGCNMGGNLLPLAAAHPGATFVGVDPAAHAMVRARARVGSNCCWPASIICTNACASKTIIQIACAGRWYRPVLTFSPDITLKYALFSPGFWPNAASRSCATWRLPRSALTVYNSVMVRACLLRRYSGSPVQRPRRGCARVAWQLPSKVSSRSTIACSQCHIRRCSPPVILPML